MSLEFKSGEFKEAVDFFRDKISLPTSTWKDLTGEMHARAFTVAGAMREDILGDFRQAVDRALTDGMSIQQFRKEFDAIVAKHGWQYNGERNWRSDLIYQTNMHTAYAAGRERQMQDPKLRKIYPYGRYRSMMTGANRRAQHKNWNNTVLPLDDPWWQTHTPPNGWGCRCWKEPVSALEVKALGLEVSDNAPTLPTDKTGIDTGWDYNVGTAAWGEPGIPPRGWTISDQDGIWADAGKERDNKLTVSPSVPLSQPTEDAATFEHRLMDGLKQKFSKNPDAVFSDNTVTVMKKIGGFTYPITISVKQISQHILGSGTNWHPDRTSMINMMLAALDDPSEVRFDFLKSNTGKLSISANFIKVFADKNKTKPILFVFRAEKGCFHSWTTYRISDKDLRKKRRGVLVQ